MREMYVSILIWTVLNVYISEMYHDSPVYICVLDGFMLTQAKVN